MKKALARIIMLVCPTGLLGWQNQTPQGASLTHVHDAGTFSGIVQSGTTSRSLETITLVKGTPVCLVSSQRISTRTARAGERVLFRVGQDVTARALLSRTEDSGPIIIPKGTEVWATIQQVRRPENWARDGKLSFTFESLPLENGNSVSLQPPTQPKTSLGQEIKDTLTDPYIVFVPMAIPFLPLMVFEKGQEPVLTKKTCVPQEIAEEVVLNKEEVLARQQESRAHIPHLSVEQTQVPQQTNPLTPALADSQALITEFDLLGSLRSIAFTPGAIWFSGPSGLTRVDASTHEVVTTIPTGASSGFIATGSGAVWVANVADKTVLRIDAENNQIIARIPVEGQPVRIAAGEGSIWIVGNDNSISRIDPQTNAVTATIHLGGEEPQVLAIGEGSVWVAISDKRSVVRIDPQTSAVVAHIRVGKQPGSIAFADHGVWVADTSGLTRIDPKTNVARRISSLLAPKWPFHLARRHVYAHILIAAQDGELWAAASDETVVRIDAKSEKVTAYIRVPPRKDFFQLAPVQDGRPSGLAVAGGFAWVSDYANQALWRIDTRTNKVAHEPVVVGFQPMVVGNDKLGRIWVINRGDGTFMEIQP
jgi:YVTN family beta-propeller protein